MSLPIVSIIGQPNVGKSSLFNTLVGKKGAIVSNTAGVTRDRQFTTLLLNDKQCWLVDTAGIAQKGDKLTQKMCEQSWQAAEQSDLNLFVVAETLCEDDVKLIRQIQKLSKPLILVINKVDLAKKGQDIEQEFARLGCKHILLVSATTKTGISDLREAIEEIIPIASDDSQASLHQIALVGKPNAGKSTLTNHYAKEDRCIVSPIPGTTRDAIKIEHQHQGKTYALIDTAGMRRKSKIHEEVEQYATSHTLRAIENASVVIHMVDATEHIARQDFRIAHLCLDMGKAVIIALNKMDLLNKDQRRLLLAEMKIEMRHMSVVPLVEISASQGRNTQKLMSMAVEFCHDLEQSFSTSQLTRMLERITKRTPPPTRLGRPINLRMAHLKQLMPLEVVIHGKRTSYIPLSYVRYLKNSFLREMNIKGRHIRIILKSDHNPYV
ncbi:ribosome biogenesis GTPase Der [Gammaproteobacteria bacterium]|nr:ribosome biogenesis GTPase Der [Gammaproteobacteria bacterium]